LKSSPEVVISFMNPTTSLTILALRGKSIPVVVVEQGSPQHFPDTKRNTYLRRQLYLFASHLITPSRATDAQFSWLSTEKRSVIANPLPLPSTFSEGGISILNPAKKHLLAMGRLAEQKGFDCLIEAFQKIAPHYPEWDLTIVGEGPQRPYLEKLIEKSPVSERMFLTGVHKNPFPTLADANIFILPSRFEPFGNVIIEAMAGGVPVIATKCDGPLEIIRDEVDGLLVEIEDIEGLAEAIQKLISDGDLRKHLATNGLKTAEKFTLANIVPQWEALLEKLIREQ
jgi:GalNAc-alpha-(1->4)-GalNAc-alpha-(1->3)-diNAcBac-PP-undecaprenol alpha-1,4-N-acetyl-D-galactosaminyltransferase